MEVNPDPWLVIFTSSFAGLLGAQEPRSVSGIYPSLAMFNNEGECGTGAVTSDEEWLTLTAENASAQLRYG
jgi:hypothetical protein